MNMRLGFSLLCLPLCIGGIPFRAPAADLTVYHIGNSLTRNLPLDRLKVLFADAGIHGAKEASAMLQRPSRAPWDAELKAVLA